MESNGKTIDRTVQQVQVNTGRFCGAVWEQRPACLYQLLHQGTHLVPADFLAPAHSPNPIGSHHAILLANCPAQAEALMVGKTEAQALALSWKNMYPGKSCIGYCPINHFSNPPYVPACSSCLTPQVLALIALYEHFVFIQARSWNINFFDQWGVELGKNRTPFA